ncbi:hypothetical protein ACFODZ_16750 [Marinicella sediminis]|uniref:Uncharacterized protein n=1 Tax=Marinicella sediminis TaxID=1792834 RepID=A0ABV7JIK9_9GAMM|nr:hypothetical protein [Marinicella sediminis]
MNTAEIHTSGDDEQRKQLMTNIKVLQRELVKTSMKPSKDALQYAQLLSAIHTERAKLKALNARAPVSG